MEGQIIQFYKNAVTLEIFLSDDDELTSKGVEYGSFIIDTGVIGCEIKYWDNLRLFLESDKKTIKKECKPDVVELGLKWKEVYEDIKYLLKKAKRLGYL